MTLELICAMDSIAESAYQTSANERAKNRLHVRRLYYKKLNLLDELHRQVKSLEAEHERVLATYKQHDAQPTPVHAIVQTDSAIEKEMVQPKSSKTVLHSAYVRLIQMKRVMAKENAILTYRCAEYMLMEQAISRLTSAQNKTLELQKREIEHKRINPPVNGNWLTPEQCFSVAMESYNEIDVLRESNTKSSTGVSVFGWQDCHAANEEKLIFSLDKVFRGQATEKRAEDMWSVLSDPKRILSMNPRDATVNYHVVQRVSDTAVLYYFTLERETNDIRERAFILVTRVDLESDRCLMVWRTLDPKKYFPEFNGSTRRGRKKIEPHKESVWLDMFLWSMYEAVGDKREDCKETFGGMLKCTLVASSEMWYLEILRILLCIETQVAGSRGLLQL